MKIDSILANIADPDEMPHKAAFHLGLQFCQSTGLGGSSPQRATRLTLPLAIVAICYKDCKVATNTSHWLKVRSRWLKNYIFAKRVF